MGEVLFSVDAGVGRITINRPEKSNALNPEVLTQLRRIPRKQRKIPECGR
jgi:enoyl-CoA hydratase/carnithine racemase